MNAVYSYPNPVDLVLGNSKIIAARSISADGKILVAVLTSEIYSHTDRIALMDEIVNLLRNTYQNDECIVTFDMSVYRKLGQELTSKEKSLLISQFSN